VEATSVRTPRTIAFGPVPSRRLGASLGINNIPAKICSYSCAYCQLGRTTKLTTKRQAFFAPEEILKVVDKKVTKATSRGERIDYLTFVPDGEPTLDLNLGKEITLLKKLGFPVAVLTNASLLWQESVAQSLQDADLVSLKVDAVDEALWKTVNNPAGALKLPRVLDGIDQFASDFGGTLISETMILRGIDYKGELEHVAEFLRKLKTLRKTYIAIPTRPPAEKWVKPADERTINAVFRVFASRLGLARVEYLLGYEGNAFAFTGNPREDLLSITSVHPMREEAVREFLRRAESGWTIVEELMQEGLLIRLDYQGKAFYMRRLSSS
jgi:wyosine [tRNA(Phe)-imidazoG37] synthetase (radical SAM superfamily)